MAELNRLRQILVSAAAAETSYGVAQTVDSLIKAELASIINPDHTTINNQDLLGATEEPDDQELLAMSNRMSLSLPRAKPHGLAFVAAYGMGLDTPTTPALAVNTVKHTITRASSITMPTFTAEGLLKSGVQNKYVGGGITDFTLRLQRGANRMGSLSSNAIFGSTVVAGTATATEPSEASINAGATTGVFLSEDGYSGTNDDDLDYTTSDLNGTPSSIASTVRSIEWSYNNNPNLEDLYRFNSGQGFGAWERGDVSQQLVLNYDWASDAEIDRLEDQTEMAFQVKIRGAVLDAVYDPTFYYGMNLILPKVKYAKVERAIDNGKLVNAVTMQVLEDSTYGSAILVVFNQQAAYAA